MRRALGYLQIMDPLFTETHETFTCSHCNSIVTMPKDTSVGSEAMFNRLQDQKKDVRRCHGCDGLICPKCYHEPLCTPFEAVLDAWERRARLRAM